MHFSKKHSDKFGKCHWNLFCFTYKTNDDNLNECYEILSHWKSQFLKMSSQTIISINDSIHETNLSWIRIVCKCITT